MEIKLKANYALDTELVQTESLAAYFQARVLDIAQAERNRVDQDVAAFHENALPYLDAIVREIIDVGIDVAWSFASTYFARQYKLSVWLVEPIKQWSEVTPIIEAVERAVLSAGDDQLRNWANVDRAETYTREYTLDVNDNFIVSIFAVLPGDTENCVRVIAGFTEGFVSKPEPIYEFRCVEGGEAKQQDAVEQTTL